MNEGRKGVFLNPPSRRAPGRAHARPHGLSPKRLWRTELAAKATSSDAQHILGFCYRSGNGVEMHEAKSARLYAQAAKQGHADAQNFLCDCYRKGRA
jgi:hypothetical protein